MTKSYLNLATYDWHQPTTNGILLVNLGTPEAPTAKAVRRYLGEFLADPRVTELPPWLWWLILNGIILRTRPRRVAHSYQQIWTEQGSPLLKFSQAQAIALRQAVGTRFVVALGMCYGQPSLATALEELRQANAQRILILPLYPQYSSATTGAVFDAIAKIFKRWRWLPQLNFVTHYYDFPAYIEALAAQIQVHWKNYGTPDKLLFSFHGIPKHFAVAGDPYPHQCQETVRQVVARLALKEQQWQMVFQSRFGREEWLQPYTDYTLINLGKSGVKRVDVICPGFAADCLETLEEINQQNRQFFLQAGGDTFHYIPALNDSVGHIQMLLALVNQHTQSWFSNQNTSQTI